MKLLGSTLTLMGVTTIFFVTMAIVGQNYHELPSRPVAYDEHPAYPEEPPRKEPSRLDRLLDSTLEHANATIWALIQAALVVRYIKKRKDE